MNAHAQYVFRLKAHSKTAKKTRQHNMLCCAGNLGVQTVAVKCDLCDFLPEGPACVRACPNQALRLITGDSLQRQMKEKQRLAASWFANGGEDPFPHSGATLMDALQLLTRSLILYLFASLASLFYSVWTDWLLSFPASHRWWAA